jgi:heme-degrading monooxygenase HmoA
MTEHATVVNISRYRAAPGQRQPLLDAMRRMASRASEGDGCFGAQACASDRDPESLVAVSRWRSAEALRAFHEDAASVTEAEHLAGLLAAPAEHENLSSL